MDFHIANPEKIQLGKFLFYDKILSGNKNISCASCHHPLTGTGDGLALPVGACHSGQLQTDHQFHALGIPQIGPGKGHGLNNHDDFGHEQVSGDAADRYRFRTPTLRNVAVTGP